VNRPLLELYIPEFIRAVLKIKIPEVFGYVFRAPSLGKLFLPTTAMGRFGKE
jgi:hypothetical protein